MQLNYLLFASVKGCFWKQDLVHNICGKIEFPCYILKIENVFMILTLSLYRIFIL